MKRPFLPVLVCAVIGSTGTAAADPIVISANPSLPSSISSGAFVTRGDVFVQDARSLSPATNNTVEVAATLFPDTIASGGASIFLDPASTTHRLLGSGTAFGLVQTSTDIV